MGHRPSPLPVKVSALFGLGLGLGGSWLRHNECLLGAEKREEKHSRKTKNGGKSDEPQRHNVWIGMEWDWIREDWLGHSTLRTPHTHPRQYLLVIFSATFRNACRSVFVCFFLYFYYCFLRFSASIYFNLPFGMPLQLVFPLELMVFHSSHSSHSSHRFADRLSLLCAEAVRKYKL